MLADLIFVSMQATWNRTTRMALETGTILVEPMTGGYLLVDHIPDKDKSHARTFVGYKAIKSA